MACSMIDGELMDQRRELNPFALSDRSFNAWQSPLFHLRLGQQVQEMADRQCRFIYWDRMPTEGMLSHIGDHKLGYSNPARDLVDGFAEIRLFEIVDIE